MRTLAFLVVICTVGLVLFFGPGLMTHVAAAGGSTPLIDAVKAGKLLATGDCDGFLQGCMGVMGAVRHLRNLPVPKEVIFPIKVFDIANYQGADIPYEERKCPAWESIVAE